MSFAAFFLALGLPQASAADGLTRLYDLYRLARPAEERVLQFSSYDRTGGNADWGNFLFYDEKTDFKTLADIQGPGIVTRIWSANPGGTLKIYLDDDEKPRLVGEFQDFFRDKIPPFYSPLAMTHSGGWISYVPIPFQKKCKITCEGGGRYYYHITFTQCSPHSCLESWGLEDLGTQKYAQAAAVLGNCGDDPMGAALSSAKRLEQVATNLKRGQKLRLVASGSRIVEGLWVKLESDDPYAGRKLVLRIWFDGSKSPCVDVPVTDFFGSGFGKRDVRALPLGQTPAGMYCYFKMPFSREMSAELVNLGEEPIPYARLQMALSERSVAEIGQYPFRFHARWGLQTAKAGEPVNLLTVIGPGNFCGTSLGISGNRGINFLEGDEQFTVDGESFPSIHGTGSEDYFNSGWYFAGGPISTAYAGCVVKDEPNSQISAYRLHIPDAIPFKESIVANIEHGGKNDYPGAVYAVTSYWYQPLDKDAKRALLTAENLFGEVEAPRRTGEIPMEDALKNWDLGSARLERTTSFRNWNRQLTYRISSGRDGFGSVRLEVPSDSVYEFGLSGKATEGTVVTGRINGAELQSESGNKEERIAIGWAEAKKGSVTLELLGTGSLEADALYAKDLLEGESNLASAEVSDGHCEEQEMGGWPQEGFSGNRQLWYPDAKQGSTLTIQVPVATEGLYEIGGWFCQAVDYGIFAVSLDEKQVGEPFDGYHNRVVRSGYVKFGEVRLKAGRHRLTFKLVGKNEKSIGYMLGIDRLEIRRRS